jgi:hypothetical protein
MAAWFLGSIRIHIPFSRTNWLKSRLAGKLKTNAIGGLIVNIMSPSMAAVTHIFILTPETKRSVQRTVSAPCGLRNLLAPSRETSGESIRREPKEKFACRASIGPPMIVELLGGIVRYGLHEGGSASFGSILPDPHSNYFPVDLTSCQRPSSSGPNSAPHQPTSIHRVERRFRYPMSVRSKVTKFGVLANSCARPMLQCKVSLYRFAPGIQGYTRERLIPFDAPWSSDHSRPRLGRALHISR